jgi:DNA-binding MarR family transcriptional regulator
MRHVSDIKRVPATEVDVRTFNENISDAETLNHGINCRSQSVSETDVRKLRRIREMRARRTRFFSDDLFSDPAWDMLVFLALAELEQQRVSISGLSAAANVPVTTALRWINSMTERQHFVRSRDPFDQRRFYIRLSNAASASMRKFLSVEYPA